MSELTALLVFGLLALAYHLTNDAPWTRIERRASQAAGALAGLGKMVERALACQPLVDEGARYLTLGEDTWTDTRMLGDALREFDLSRWKVDRFEGGVAFNDDSEEARVRYRHWFGVDPDPLPAYRARVFYVLRDGRGGWEMLKAGLAGNDLEMLLRTFAGCAFSQSEVEQLGRAC